QVSTRLGADPGRLADAVTGFLRQRRPEIVSFTSTFLRKTKSISKIEARLPDGVRVVKRYRPKKYEASARLDCELEGWKTSWLWPSVIRDLPGPI
ncbi:hypothetical protein, partial [Nocardioides caeni]|uniref:hypothetical protein n=1 Tax=Nocardioides caeni TaxID=574700 RepID=UPI001EE79648